MLVSYSNSSPLTPWFILCSNPESVQSFLDIKVDIKTLLSQHLLSVKGTALHTYLWLLLSFESLDTDHP